MKKNNYVKDYKVAQIIPALRLKRNLHFFDYYIPKELEAQIKIGQLVEIPFRNQMVKGVVLNFAEESFNNQFELKFINKAIDPLFGLASWQLALIRYIADYYFVSMAMVLKMLLPDIPKRKVEKYKEKIVGFKTLKDNQVDIEDIYKNNKPILLVYSDFQTKISVYNQIIKKNIAANLQTVIIVPELINIWEIYSYLGEYKDLISIFLNNLHKNEFWQEWVKIKNGQIKVIMGTRSAIFAPFKNLGVIIIDEEDNINHKQEEPNPRYNVKTVALKLTELTKAKIILSAATPSVNALYQVEKEKWDKHILDQVKELPLITIINRQEEFKKGNYSILSEKLRNSINQNISNKNGTFLFINRKGSATLISCKDCNYIASCPTCKLPLTYHKNSQQLHCHHCDYKTDLFLFCPKCKSPEIKLTGIGTEKVEQEIHKLYPGLKIAIIDKENPIQDIEADIIIGTQLALNYIDWEKIHTIGVINADTLFYIPDYKSLEKTFNLFWHLMLNIPVKDKELICQTMVPENYIFTALKQPDQQIFYINEIKERVDLHYPPVVKLVKLIYQDIDFNSGEQEINEVYKVIKSKTESNKNILINPPLLVYTQQVRGRFRWQIIIKIIDDKINLDFLNSLPESVIIDVDPENLL